MSLDLPLIAVLGVMMMFVGKKIDIIGSFLGSLLVYGVVKAIIVALSGGFYYAGGDKGINGWLASTHPGYAIATFIPLAIFVGVALIRSRKQMRLVEH